jgi:hypothetical protein
MVRGPRHASWQSMRNCMGGARWPVDWYGCGGNTYGKGGGEERGIAQWGRRWEVDNYGFPFTSRGELVVLGGLRCRSGYCSHKRAGMAT